MAIPDSLLTVYDELERSIPNWQRPNHGNLEAWARRGVLLLNQALTVKPGDDVAHARYWTGFVKAVLEKILQSRPHTVFLLWGNNAKSMKKYLGNSNILEAGHPSPLNTKRDFIGCDHFNKANEILEKNGLTPIDWSL
jgi:uracil-DNA glycosylase